MHSRCVNFHHLWLELCLIAGDCWHLDEPVDCDTVLLLSIFHFVFC